MPALIRPNPEKRYLFHLGRTSYCTISQAADRYCRHFWKAGVQDVVRGIAPEPPTGEVIAGVSAAA